MIKRPFHDQRPLVAAAAAYGLGVGMGIFLPWKPFLYAIGMICGLMILWLLPKAGRRRVLGWMTLLLFLGALNAGFRAHPVLPPEGLYRVQATASADFSVREDGKAAGYLENAVIRSEAGETRISRVYWTYTPEADAPFLPREGERISFSCSLYHPQGRVNPYGSDFRLFLLQNGVSVGLSGVKDAQIAGRPGRGVFSFFYQTRKWLEERVRLIFGEESALPEALLLGIRDQLPEETRFSFTKAGIAHILTVSGLHTGLLAGAVLWVLRKLFMPRPRFFLLGIFLLFYCALLNFPAPAVRASLMMLLWQLHSLVRRAPDDLTLLAAAFLLILLLSPLALLSASFVLSFSAMLGICLWKKQAEKKCGFLHVRFIREGVSLSISATLGAILPSVYYFHQFSVIGLLMNPFVCGLFGVLLPAYALLLLTGCIYLPAGKLLAFPVNYATRLFTDAVSWVSKLPFSMLRLPSPPWFAAILLIAAALILTRFIALPPNRKRILAGTAAVLAFAGCFAVQNRDVRYVQLAAGQADAAIVTDGKITTLIDTGDYGKDAAAYLLSTGRRADRVILTHLHGDHCLGIKDILAEEIPIGAVYLPEGGEECLVQEACGEMMERLRSKGIPVYFLHAGDTLETARTKMTVLWPRQGKTEPGIQANRYALVSLWDLDGVQLLSMSDLEGGYEQYAMADADIVKIAHHGSGTSTGAEFLKMVSPQMAFVTGNGRGTSLPSRETLSRLADAGVLVYNTGDVGALTLTVKNGEGRLETYLSGNKEEKQP